ncbi:MAG: hypothetical protein WAN05_25815 [Roseiarcus sp.]
MSRNAGGAPRLNRQLRVFGDRDRAFFADFQQGPQPFHRTGFEPPPSLECVAQRLKLDADPYGERGEVEADQNRRIEAAAKYWDAGRILNFFIARRLNIRVYQRIGFFPDIFTVEDDHFPPLQQAFFTARFHFRVIKIIP